MSKLVKNGQFWTDFDHFWPFFLKHSNSAWQTFFSINTVTLVTNFLFLKHSDLVWQPFLKKTVIFCLAVNLFSKKIRKLVTFQKQISTQKIGLGYSTLWAPSISNSITARQGASCLVISCHVGSGCYTDMEKVQNFTRAAFFVSRFYPKVRELLQFWNRDKTAYFKCKYNVYNIYWVTIHRLGKLHQFG